MSDGKAWKNHRALIVGSLICLVPLAVSAVFYTRLPPEVAVQWGTDGRVTNTSPRWFAAFGMPLILLALHIVCCLTLDNDPRREGASRVLRSIGKWAIPVVSVLSNLLMLYNALSGTFNPVNLGTGLLGLLLVVVGNYLPKCRRNYTVGIKLPWTLHSEENWNRTHRAAGIAYMAAGLLLLSAGLLVEWLAPVLLLLAVGFPCVYSFVLYKKGI